MNINAAASRSVDDLITAIQQGSEPEYLFFWGHTPKEAGCVDQSCLSNWFPAPFEAAGVRYPTTEHYMMAEKARLFGDSEMLKKIIRAQSPGAAKRLGRKVRGFSDDVWAANRFEIVVAGNLAKFEQNPEMGCFLVETGSAVLVEAAPRDQIWGIGLGRNHFCAGEPARWRGLNLLGFALMEVRSRLTA